MTLSDLSQPRWMLSSLLIAGAALFAIGIAAERQANADHTKAPSEVTHTDETTGEGTTNTEAPGGEATGHSESSAETVLGINLESNTLLIVAAAVSLALAALTWLRNRRGLLFATMAFALAFAVFDIAEVAHQLEGSRAGLAILAAAIALVHVATALVAEQRATTALA